MLHIILSFHQLNGIENSKTITTVAALHFDLRCSFSFTLSSRRFNLPLHLVFFFTLFYFLSPWSLFFPRWLESCFVFPANGATRQYYALKKICSIRFKLYSKQLIVPLLYSYATPSITRMHEIIYNKKSYGSYITFN